MLVCLGISCSPKLNMQYQRTGLVKSVKHDRMTIHLTSEARAETAGKAAAFAERNAIENLLYKGIPDSNQERAIIDNEGQVNRQHPNFYEDFIINRGFENYVMSSNIVDNYNNGGVHFITIQIQVDLNNLRKHLNKTGIIKSFGY